MHPELDGSFIAAARTAMMFQKAVDQAHRHREVGHCSTKIRLFRASNSNTHYFNEYEKPNKKYAVGWAYSVNGWPYQDDEGLKNDGDKEPLTRNEVLVDRLAHLAARMPVHASGTLDTPFTLEVSRPGCALTGAVQPTRSYCAPQSAEAQQLARLFANAAASAYGDMRDHETKPVDSTVRQAREISASEFTVAPALLERVCALWAGRLGPQNVRAEPDKIHLFAEGGPFDMQLDTPERGLVGTFLLGAGDSTGEESFELTAQREYSPSASRRWPLWDSDEEDDVMDQGAESHEVMEVDSNSKSKGGGGRHTFSAKPGHWVAFYPDVPRRVISVKSGYNAVVAFKIFQDDGRDQPETQADTATITGIRSITDALEAPLALILRRRYCLGPRWLSGFDTLLYTALTRRTDVNVHLIPIVIDFSASVELNYNFKPVRRSFGALVYPFTAEHIDYLAEARKTDPAKSTMPWLAGLEKTVQFLAMDFEGSTVQWSHKKWDDSFIRGDETQEYTEDSVYLSYALIIIPKAPREDAE
ncbi:hypothetical protein FA95DRAFT_116947 [Auriscalpium vulgare]|uniref:Uncharacterized protein n=1 Tax=Auriscalpium vulgare TaxID=40419 RepID=A0ACB8RNU1_9AGAM|nr:hypothetical protein FA95DRAFT_116947 [Auriscalpium vulgare]